MTPIAPATQVAAPAMAALYLIRLQRAADRSGSVATAQVLRYVALCNHRLPHSALKNNTPMQSIKDCYYPHPPVQQEAL